MLVKAVINTLKEIREEICDELNGMVNVPLVSDRREEDCIQSIFHAVIEILEKVLSK